VEESALAFLGRELDRHFEIAGGNFDKQPRPAEIVSVRHDQNGAVQELLGSPAAFEIIEQSGLTLLPFLNHTGREPGRDRGRRHHQSDGK